MIVLKKAPLRMSVWAGAVVVVGLLLFICAHSITRVGAAGETISATASTTTEIKTATAITGLQINGSDNSTVPVKLRVTSGSLAMSITTGLTFTGSSSGSTLYFSGSRSNVNAALATLTYTRTTVGTDTLEISLVSSGEVFFSDNGHLYEYVSDTLTWGGAKTAAEGRTKYGATGYLATITSQAENDFVSARLSNAGWMGASDAAFEGVWRWVTGPENGTQFCSGNNPCNSVSGRYTNWNNGEPNDSSSNEDCGQFLSGGSGKWNDLPCSGTTLPGYVVEYGAPGNMPTVAAANVTITTSDTISPTVPTLSAVTTPTTNATPTVSWTASTDLGTGLQNPAYTLEWSPTSAFTTVSGSRTTNSLTLAPSVSLSDGTWYFRVKATDAANNVAVSAVSNAVVIDTTAPSPPSISTDSPRWSYDNTPTFAWTPSVDNGVGLATISYGVEWSQDTSFFGLGGTAGVTENTYTIPDGLNMVDGTWYFRVKAIDALGHASAWSDYATIHIDTVAPVMSDVVVTSGLSASQKIVTWTTSKDTSSRVLYGPTIALATYTAETNTVTRVRNHSVTLEGLAPCSKYQFAASSSDAAGNVATSAEQTFMTDGCAGSADILALAEETLTTASGGSVGLGTLLISVPANFSTNTANFQIKRIERNTSLGFTGVPVGVVLANTNVYDIKALQGGTSYLSAFDRPIRITMQYTSEEIAQLVEESLVIYRWDEDTGWSLLDDCIVDQVANTVTCTTTHFSTFALYGQQKKLTTPSQKYVSPVAIEMTDESAQLATKDANVSEVIDKADPTTNQQPVKKGADQSPWAVGLVWVVAGAAFVVVLWWLIAKKRRKKDK